MNLLFSFNRLGCFLVAVVSGLASWSLCAESVIHRPDFPKTCFVRGRPATLGDSGTELEIVSLLSAPVAHYVG